MTTIGVAVAVPAPWADQLQDYRESLGDETAKTIPTHITLMTKPFLRMLFVLEGLRRRADLEERMDWAKKDRVLVYERR